MNARYRVAVHALGCKLNQAELEMLAAQFEARGFTVVSPREKADVYVINTCTVTAEADRKVRQWLRSVRRHNPQSLTVATGCYVQRVPGELDSLADVLADNDEKSRVVDAVEAQLQKRRGCVEETHSVMGGDASSRGRTRSLVKVQEGCSTPCAYCIVPLVRLGQRSMPAEEVLQTVRQRIRDGHKEIVLTGTKIGAYRDGGTELAGLVRTVLGVPGLLRLRLSSLQPGELSVELLSLWEDGRLCPHFHLSLQSGSPTVLRRMSRAYSPPSYMRALEAIRAVVPDAAITTDVIVGFPGESDSEFGETVSFCETAAFARIHVFPYSSRPGTRAAGMGGVVAPSTMRERVGAMSRLASSSREKYARSWLGRTAEVLWEEETKPGSHVYSGTSHNYLRLLCRSALPLHNVLEDVTLEHLVGDAVWVRRAREDTCGRQAELEGGLH